jgi:N4-(beta-N-acetylglucosaminyl)-L-asparaginase
MPKPSLSRRELLRAAAAAGAVPAFRSVAPARRERDPGIVVIASGNGLKAVEEAYRIAEGGGDPLEAAVAGVVLVELDPNDHSVGLGGIPNEEGVVELDASVMHGPRCAGGAVAGLRNIATPSKVAKLVMERTDHVLLVGEGALKFARAHGFEETNLLTPEARKIWLHWKETLSKEDDWLEPVPDDAGKEVHEHVPHDGGTIHLSVRTAAGDLAGCTTTSGLGFKLPGRVGDSPILGAGLYVENEVGAAGSTGRGEAVILSGGARTVVEEMRAGRHPKDACLAALERIARGTKRRDLLDAKGRPNFGVVFYAVNRAGAYGAAVFRGERRFAVCDRSGPRHENAAALYGD